MACALLPAGAAAAALPSPRRRADLPKGQPNQAACMINQLHWKLPLTAESHWSRSLVGCCTFPSSSSEAAISSRSADVSSGHTDVSTRDSVYVVPGAPIVISGYWIGPDMDDGCGHSSYSAKDFLIMYGGKLGECMSFDLGSVIQLN